MQPVVCTGEGFTGGEWFDVGDAGFHSVSASMSVLGVVGEGGSACAAHSTGLVLEVIGVVVVVVGVVGKEAMEGLHGVVGVGGVVVAGIVVCLRRRRNSWWM